MRARRHRRILPSVSSPDFEPPAIDTLPESVDRPRFSVMIPTFNCAEYLRVCLTSVLGQDLGPARMQIEVIDDCSTLDDPEAVVRELGAGRVVFTRQEHNVGAVGNFNTCIRRSTGELVHILHGDDFVLPGFYAEIDRMANTQPGAGMYATSVRFADEVGALVDRSEPLTAYEGGPSRSIAPFGRGTPVQFAGCVVRRRAYEEVGGFLPGLLHVADWEMWIRIVGQHGMVGTSAPFAAYRRFMASDSSRLIRTASNLEDLERGLQVLIGRGVELNLEVLLQKIRTTAKLQGNRLAVSGDSEGARVNLEFWRRRATPEDRLRRIVGLLRGSLVRRGA